jgi:hypothetical protein
MSPIEQLMHDLVTACEALLHILCRDSFAIHPSLITASDTLDLVATVSIGDAGVLRQSGADIALDILAGVVRTRSGVARVSIQIDEAP